MDQLTYLYLKGNQIREIPAALVRLPKLRFIDLDDNPLQEPPLEIYHRGRKALRNYFHQK